LASDRLNPAAGLRPVFDTINRKAINISVPVYKSVHSGTRCLNSPVEHSGNHNDSPKEPDVYRMLDAFASRHRYVTLKNRSVFNADGKSRTRLIGIV
jgi:hypothetical protein